MKKVQNVLSVIGVIALVVVIFGGVFLLGRSSIQQPTNTVMATPSGPIVVPYGSTLVPMAANTQIVGVTGGQLFRSPVQCTSSFNSDSAWLICEPGVLLDASTAWTIPGTKETWNVNVPEGGFTYFSLGGGKITVDGVSINLPFEKGLNYLVLIRGRIDDGIVDTDLNVTAKVSDFKPGHAIWSHTPTGAYVSKDWFRQQLVASTTSGFTNCGATGCSRVRIILFDVDSHFFQEFETLRGTIDTWQVLSSN